jgi:hypothetical protein
VLANNRVQNMAVVALKEEEDVEMKENNDPFEKERQLFKDMLV